jgi:hypothetical protein
MATLAEHQIVELTRPIDKDEVLTRGPEETRGIEEWPAGTEGAIVIDFGGDKLIEIYDQNGIALDFSAAFQACLSSCSALPPL